MLPFGIQSIFHEHYETLESMIYPSLKPIALATLLITGAAEAQVSFPSSGYTQNFDGIGTGTAFSTSGTSTLGWSHIGSLGGSNTSWTTSIPTTGAQSAVTAGTANNTLTVNSNAAAATGSSNTVAYNLALSTSTTDRCVGTSPTSGAGNIFQLRLTNNSGAALSGIRVSYDIRRFSPGLASGTPTNNQLPGYWLFYSIDNGTSWTNVSALNPTITTVPNTAGVTNIPVTTINFASSVANGSEMRFRWIDDNAQETSPDHIMGLDNVSFSLAQAAPTVSLTAPANNSTTALPAPVNFVANAADSNGTVTKVEFFQGTTKLGEVLNPGPYQFSWTGMISGAYVLTAKATDNDGAVTTSAPINVTVTNPNNIAPTTSISSITNGTSIPASSLTLAADAADTDGIVTKVEFFNGATKLGEDLTSPYTFAIPVLDVGTYAFTSRATDNDGGVTTSAVVNVNAVTYTDTTSVARAAVWKYSDTGADLGTAWKETAFNDSAWSSAPAVLGFGDTHIISTLNIGPASPNQTITYYFRRSFTVADATQVIGLRTNLLRDDGAVIYINGVEVARSNMPTGAINYLTVAPVIVSNAEETTYFPITLPNSAVVTGNNVIAVEIHQRDGTSSDLGFDLDLITTTAGGNTRPAVAITAPASGSNVTFGVPIPIAATATDSDGSIAKVEFYQGSTKLGEDLTGPDYTFNWTSIPTATYSLTAVATDDLGSTATSAPVIVNVIPGPSGTLTRSPYLNMPNQNSIVVRWRASTSIVGRVRYGTSPTNLDQFVDESTARTDHDVRITGLTPSTRYYYSVGSATDTLTPELTDTTSVRTAAYTNYPVPTAADYTFRTSPIPGTAPAEGTRVWIVGDCGRGSTNQAGGRDAYYNFMGSRTPDLCLQLGDNAYNSGTETEYQTGYFLMYPTIFRKMPQWSCLGNHDANNGTTTPTTNFPYFDMFTFPTNAECGGLASGTEHYYSFDYANIHFICFDSQTTLANSSASAPQTVWLKADLAATTQPWIVVFLHHPPYTKGSHDSDTESQLITTRTVYNPIFEQGGVDVIFSGHSHNYERSYLLDGHYGNANTITPAMRKNGGNGSTTGFTTSSSGNIRRAPAFAAVANVAGTVIPPDGAYIKPLTGPRDHFGAVYNTAGMSGQADGGTLSHNAMYISYDQVGTVNMEVVGNTLTCKFIQSGNTVPDNFTITKQGAADTDGDGISDAYEIANGLNRYGSDTNTGTDSDGLSNFLEFAFGLNPNANDAGAVEADVPGALLTKRGQPAVWYQATNNGTDFRILFTRRKDYQTDGLVYTPEFSGDLATWVPSPNTSPTVIATDGEIELVSIKYPFFAAGKKARFFRVGVSSTH